jgi:hypothetical protein
MRSRFRKRSLLVAAGLVALLAAVPAVIAATGTFNGAAERQSAKWTSTQVSTSSTTWQTVPGLSLTRCAKNQATVAISVTVNGGPVRFRAVIDDVPEAPMRPYVARFVPNGSESFGFTFVRNVAAFEADDTHRFDIQWQSPTGVPVKLVRGMMNLTFQKGTQGC